MDLDRHVAGAATSSREVTEREVETEQSPLLGRGDCDVHRTTKLSPQWIVAFTCATILIIDFAGYLALPPQTMIFEDIACKQFYRNSPTSVPQSVRDCKVEPVQSEVALLNGWKETFDQVPGLLLALPYGFLADRIGRKPVLILAQIGLMVEDILVKIVCWWPNVFPVKLVWACAAAQFIGGGAQVASAMIFAIAADFFPDRTAAFYRLFAAVLIAEMFGNPTAATLMVSGPWLPYFISLALQFLGLLVSFAVPETLELAESKVAEEDETVDDNSIKSNSASTKSNLIQKAAASVRDLMAFARQGDRNFYALIFVFLVATLGRQTAALLLLYTSKKFRWSFGKASLILSLRAVVNLVATLVILPFVSYLFLKYATSGMTGRDLRISQISSILCTVGCILIGFAAAPASLIFGVVVFALGSAFHITARSLVTSLVSPNQVGTLYTALAFVSGTGILISGPILAYSFHGGLALGEPWLGLPFLVTGGLFLLSALAMGSVSLKRLQQASAEDEAQ